jgi:hypothetical protein
MASINSLRSGVLDKLIIKFTNVFWDASKNWFNYISPAEPCYYLWTQTLNLYKFTGEPVLVMFNCERSARYLA